MQKILSTLLACALLLGASSCAKQGYPSGGPSDKTPPVVLASTPANESHSFAENGFYIAFDEYVVIKDADNNVLVSPPMKSKPTYSTKGRGIRVEWKDTLQPNTTYLFQFKNAIADFNEGNILPSFEYVFSTGDVLDSMTLSGRVVDALTGAARKDPVTVMLYGGEESLVADSVVVGQNPRYVTRCDEAGAFEFNHIRPGRYKIVALEDGDKDMRLGSAEPMAFSDSLWTARVLRRVVADSAAADTSQRRLRAKGSQPTLYLSEPVSEVQRVTSSDFKSKGRAVLTTLSPMLSPAITPLCDSLHWRLNALGDTLSLWTVSDRIDSLHFILSDPSGLQDTLKLRYRAPKKMGAVTEVPLMKSTVGSKMNYFDTLSLRFSNPVHLADEDARAEVLSLKDSLHTYCGMLLQPDALSARLDFAFEQGEKYLVTIPKGCFADIYGHRSDSLSLALEVTTPAQYGTLVMHLSLSALQGQLLVQLLDEKDNILRQSVVADPDSPLRFEHLKAGKYRLRAIFDLNANGKWDAGNYWQHLQPERAVYFGKTMEVRENWDFEENWNLD